MKKTMFLVSLAVVLGLVLVGCPQPTDSGNGGGETPTPVETGVFGTIESANVGTLIGVKGGNYTYGEVEIDPSDLRYVESLYLAETEVTQDQWLAVMGSALPDPTNSFDVGAGGNYPMYYVSWYDAVEFCNALTRMELTDADVVYYVDADADRVYDSTIDVTPVTSLNNTGNVVVNTEALGYRLPTVTEFQYVAGGGLTDRTSHAGVHITRDVLDPDDLDGDGDYDEADGIDDNDSTKDLKDYAWYYLNAGGTSHPVGEKQPNALGFYDMSGNITEWTYSFFSSAWAGSGPAYVGGNWDSSTYYVEVTSYTYGYIAASGRDSGLGFRVARNVGN